MVEFCGVECMRKVSCGRCPSYWQLARAAGVSRQVTNMAGRATEKEKTPAAGWPRNRGRRGGRTRSIPANHRKHLPGSREGRREE